MNLSAIANEMKSAQDLCGQIAPFTARVSGFDSAAGYEVARLIHEARIHGGAAPVGRKVSGSPTATCGQSMARTSRAGPTSTIRPLSTCPAPVPCVALNDSLSRGSSRRSSCTSAQRQP